MRETPAGRALQSASNTSSGTASDGRVPLPLQVEPAGWEARGRWSSVSYQSCLHSSCTARPPNAKGSSAARPCLPSSNCFWSGRSRLPGNRGSQLRSHTLLERASSLVTKTVILSWPPTGSFLAYRLPPRHRRSGHQTQAGSDHLGWASGGLRSSGGLEPGPTVFMKPIGFRPLGRLWLTSWRPPEHRPENAKSGPPGTGFVFRVAPGAGLFHRLRWWAGRKSNPHSFRGGFTDRGTCVRQCTWKFAGSLWTVLR